MNLQFAVEGGVWRVTEVGDDALDFPGFGLPLAADLQLEAAVRAVALDGVDDALRMIFDVALNTRGQGVRPQCQAVAAAQRVVGETRDRLRTDCRGPARSPRCPAVPAPACQVGHCRRRGVT